MFGGEYLSRIGSWLAALFISSLVPGFVSAQTFTELGTDFSDFRRLGVSWGDYDNDNDLDLLMIGDFADYSDLCKIYRNDDGDFIDIGVNIPPLDESDAEWGDYDNDGDLDFAVCGTAPGIDYVTRIYRNDGNDNFEDIQADLVGVSLGLVRWGDYDNDGDLDLLVLGGANYPELEFTAIYRNDGNDTFTLSSAPLFHLDRGSADWGDYDNDGDADIIVTGRYPGGISSTRTLIYRNDGSGLFTEVTSGFFNLYDGQGRWADYDLDGDLDILVTGSDSTGGAFFTFVYRNDGNDVFTDVHASIGAAGEGSSVAWGDCDNDGDPDALVSNLFSFSGFATAVYRNDGDSIFTDLEVGIDISCCGSVAWADIDGDLDLDFIASGYFRTKLYRNDAESPNTPPSAPDNLASEVSGNQVTLSWQPASDAETLPAGLTYNLRIGTSPSGTDIVSGMADPATGYRRVAAMGNAYQDTSWTITDLSVGVYFWSVQAIDNCFIGSAFAAEHQFVIGEPSYVCGDADANEIVNISDAVYLIAYIFGGGSAPDPYPAGDADCNGIVNISDAVYLIAYIFGGGPAPCATCE
jgi:hypothetical protein